MAHERRRLSFRSRQFERKNEHQGHRCAVQASPIPTKTTTLSARHKGAGERPLAPYLDATPAALSLRQMARSRSGFSGCSSPSGVACAHIRSSYSNPTRGAAIGGAGAGAGAAIARRGDEAPERRTRKGRAGEWEVGVQASSPTTRSREVLM